MKVLFAASEAVPFIKSGGLGDVAGALPPALRKKMIGARVVLPLYQEIPQEMKDTMHFVKEIWVPLAWRSQYCGIFEAKVGQVTYYLLDNQYYFGRRGLYGHFDDAERFAFFSKAVLEIIQYIDFQPDVIHCNDWQTAMIPIYLNHFYKTIGAPYKDIKTVLTIHNIQYQGVFPDNVTEYVLGLPREYFTGGYLDFGGCVNFLKAGILSADWVTTVSPTYAEELQYEFYGYGLQDIIRSERAKVSGIINGIDYNFNDPEKDPHLFKNYSVDDLEGKEENKIRLQEMLGLPVNPNIPMIAMVTRLADHKGLDLVASVLYEILSEDVQFVVLGTGSWEYEDMFRKAHESYPQKVSVNLTFNTDLAQKIYAGADLFLMPSKNEPCGLSQMISMRYGTLPIVRETGGLKDTVEPYNEFTGEGTGFSFHDYSAQDMLHVIRNALNTFYEKDAWTKLMKNAMSKDFSWNIPAREYLALYRLITGKR